MERQWQKHGDNLCLPIDQLSRQSVVILLPLPEAIYQILMEWLNTFDEVQHTELIKEVDELEGASSGEAS